MEKKVMELINCLSNARKLIEEINSDETTIISAAIEYDGNGKMQDPKIHFHKDLPAGLFFYVEDDFSEEFTKSVAHVGDVRLYHLEEKEAGDNAKMAV